MWGGAASHAGFPAHLRCSGRPRWGHPRGRGVRLSSRACCPAARSLQSEREGHTHAKHTKRPPTEARHRERARSPTSTRHQQHPQVKLPPLPAPTRNPTRAWHPAGPEQPPGVTPRKSRERSQPRERPALVSTTQQKGQRPPSRWSDPADTPRGRRAFRGSCLSRDTAALEQTLRRPPGTRKAGRALPLAHLVAWVAGQTQGRSGSPGHPSH